MWFVAPDLLKLKASSLRATAAFDGNSEACCTNTVLVVCVSIRVLRPLEGKSETLEPDVRGLCVQAVAKNKCKKIE